MYKPITHLNKAYKMCLSCDRLKLFSSFNWISRSGITHQCNTCKGCRNYIEVKSKELYSN